MRLELLLPPVDPEEWHAPRQCPYARCGGRHFRLHQVVGKPVGDTVHKAVTARRYECRRCHRTFRVYPTGVTHAPTSQRVKGLSVTHAPARSAGVLYLLGLSYGAVALALDALGVYLCKSQVYEAVQAAAKQVPGMKRRQVFASLKTPALGADVTSVKCRGKWLALGLSVDPVSGLVLSVDRLPSEDAQLLQTWLTPIAQAVGAKLLVSDDADGFKSAADQLGLDQQVCKAHVVRNTDALVESLTPAVQHDADGSLAALGVSPAQAVADVKRLGELVHSRQPQQAAELAELAARYAPARSPRGGQPFSLAYRLRLLFLDRWNLWGRLTRYRTWRGPAGEQLDGTNNACERGIGWWIKERYRGMRGYPVVCPAGNRRASGKRPQSAVNVSRLLARCGNYLGRGGADLAKLMA